MAEDAVTCEPFSAREFPANSEFRELNAHILVGSSGKRFILDSFRCQEQVFGWK
jgi:hypothetical protein